MFDQYVEPSYPQIKELASKAMSIFARISVCEQLFSLMKSNKSRFQYLMTDAYLKFNSTIKVATAQPSVSDIRILVIAKICQVYSSHSAMNK